jgi:hypothetical protein
MPDRLLTRRIPDPEQGEIELVPARQAIARVSEAIDRTGWLPRYKPVIREPEH